MKASILSRLHNDHAANQRIAAKQVKNTGIHIIDRINRDHLTAQRQALSDR